MHQDTVLRLIDQIYLAAGDASAWPVFPTAFSEELQATAAGLLQHEIRLSELQGMVAAASAVDPVSTELYGSQYAALDPWGIALARQKRLNTDHLVTSESLVPMAHPRRTEYYNNYARRFD